NPRIDHDALVEHAIEHVDQAGSSGSPLDGHCLPLLRLPPRRARALPSGLLGSRWWRERRDTFLERPQLSAERGVLFGEGRAAPRREVLVVFPPVEPDRLRFV